MISFKEFWNKNSRIVLIVLIGFLVAAAMSIYAFGGAWSDLWIWAAILGFVALVLFIGSIIDYNKTQK